MYAYFFLVYNNNNVPHFIDDACGQLHQKNKKNIGRHWIINERAKILSREFQLLFLHYVIIVLSSLHVLFFLYL